MIQLQRLTGMRSGEVVVMRVCDIDTPGKIWQYTPPTHKTQHHGHMRSIYLGPLAQAVVRPFLKADLSAFLFSPAEAEAERKIEIRQHRKSKVQPSQVDRRRRRPKRKPGERYDVQSYKRAVYRGCAKACPPPDGLSSEEARSWELSHRWHPHQLRHNAATRMRKEFGIEAARVVLGHRSAAVTEIYAEADRGKAAEIMARVG
ncbi:MAG TPA: site-specific integrase [Phycisphaerae bacterium]|nr:site-specific integrase [Phycisphaerae bacterium]